MASTPDTVTAQVTRLPKQKVIDSWEKAEQIANAHNKAP
jgi:hypothetical protein